MEREEAERKWEEYYDDLVRFGEEHGHVDVPYLHKEL